MNIKDGLILRDNSWSKWMLAIINWKTQVHMPDNVLKEIHTYALREQSNMPYAKQVAYYRGLNV